MYHRYVHLLGAKCHVIYDHTHFPSCILKLTLTVLELLHYYLRFAICDCLYFIECSAFVTIKGLVFSFCVKLMSLVLVYVKAFCQFNHAGISTLDLQYV